jgi:hypothetical protein
MTITQCRSSRLKVKQAQGTVTQYSYRIAKSGSQAHSFFIGTEKFTLFSGDEFAPIVDGDIVSFEYEVRHLKNKHRTEYFSVLADTLVIAAPAELGSEVSGHVYILSNVSMPGLLKVGFTTGTVTKRAFELSSVTSVPTPFKVEWSCPVTGNARAVEQRTHAALAAFRSGKEFFKCTLGQAQESVTRSFAELYPEKAMEMDAAFQARAAAEILRRDELVVRQIKRQEEQAEEDARLEFEKSPEGIWRKRGTIVATLINWVAEPERYGPGFFASLFGAKPEDYLDIQLEARQYGDAVVWVLLLEGRLEAQRLQQNLDFATQEAAAARISELTRQSPSVNKRVVIRVPNCLVENPPPLPGGRLTYGMTIDVTSIEGFVVRPDPTQPIRRNRR